MNIIFLLLFCLKENLIRLCKSFNTKCKRFCKQSTWINLLQQANTTDTKQIVMSDADIVTNEVSETTGPLPMGELPYENYRFANREFFLNCIDYLTSTSGIFESRNKDFTLRLLDKKKVADQKLNWQLINIVIPIAVIILFGLVYQWKRKNSFGM